MARARIDTLTHTNVFGRLKNRRPLMHSLEGILSPFALWDSNLFLQKIARNSVQYKPGDDKKGRRALLATIQSQILTSFRLISSPSLGKKRGLTSRRERRRGLRFLSFYVTQTMPRGSGHLLQRTQVRAPRSGVHRFCTLAKARNLGDCGMRVLLLDPGGLTRWASHGQESTAALPRCRLDFPRLVSAERRCVEMEAAYAPNRCAITQNLAEMERWHEAYGASIGLLSVASSLRDASVSVEYRNLEYEARSSNGVDRRAVERLLSMSLDGCDVVGVTSMTESFLLAKGILGICKEINPSIVTVLGGAHASAEGAPLAAHPEIDIVAEGAAEDSFPEYCLSGAKVDVPGGATLRTGGVQGVPGFAEPHAPVELCHSPALDMLPGGDNGCRPNCGVVMTSRGCRYRCTYCAESTVLGKESRFRSPDSVVDEIQYLHRRFGLRHFSFPDSSLDLSKPHLMRLAEALSSLDGFTFGCNLRPGSFDEEMVAALLEAQFTSIYLGMESFVDEILASMRRPPYRTFLRSLGTLIELGVPIIGGGVMVGLPGENRETLSTTRLRLAGLIRDARRAGSILHVVPAIYTPYPPTAPFRSPYAFGMELLSLDFDCYDRHTAVHRLADLASSEIVAGCEALFGTILKAYED